MTSINPHIMHVYGIEYTLEIGGIVGICVGIVNAFGSIIAFIISKYYKTGEELQKPYKYLFFIGAILCIISFYFALYEGNDKFIFPDILIKDRLYNIQNNDSYNNRESRKNKIYIQLNNM